MRQLIYRFLPLVFLPQCMMAQDTISPKFWFSVYAEAYYSAAPSQAPKQQLPDFFFNHTRSNVPDLNLAFINLHHLSRLTRGSLALAAGSYVNRNLSAERFPFNNIFELNAGLCLSGRYELWLDAGILPSHIGFESAVSKNCWTLTRSIAADNSPYYETGIRLSGNSAGKKLSYALLLLNGWQTVTVPFNTNNLGVGTQLNFKPGKRVEINWSTYAGTDDRTNPGLPRFFHNIYMILNTGGRLAFILGADLGMQQKEPGKIYQYWYSPQILARYRILRQLHLAMRAEKFRDEHEVVIHDALTRGFDCSAFSCNIDYAPFERVLIRAEVKYLKGNTAIFKTRTGEDDENIRGTIALALSF